MTREGIQENVLKLVTELSGMEGCAMEMDLMDDVGLSSIGVMDLICALEDAYNVKIPSRELRFVATVEDLVELIAQKTGG